MPFVISVVGVWISMRPPASERHPRWRWGLIGFGLLVSTLTFWQQYRARSAAYDDKHRLQITIENTNDILEKTRQELQNSRLDSARSTSFLSGQVSTLMQVATNPPRNPDFTIMAAALKSLSKNPSILKEETNKELRVQVSDLARRLREMQSRVSQEQQRRILSWQQRSIAAARDNPAEMSKIDQEERAYYLTMEDQNTVEFGPLRAEGMALRQKLLSRVKPLPNEPRGTGFEEAETQRAISTLLTGRLAGPDPLLTVANYLETLANLLPGDGEK